MRRRTILGLDILPSRDGFYAVVLDERGHKVWEGEIGRAELPDLVKRFKVHRIGIDNVFELASNPNELASLLRRLKVRVFQVTGHPSHSKKLSQVASEFGLWKGGKLSPRDAAEISAMLALNGVGAEVSIFDDVSEVIISRTRSLGEGGQHQNKYARALASLIQSVLTEVEDKLKANNLLYDVMKHEGDFGVKGARIYIYAPYSVVKRIIGEHFSNLVRVEVRPVERSRLVFLPPGQRGLKTRYIICGIDPGETIGVAVLDLRGRVLGVSSKKFFAVSELIEYMYSFGKPLLLAADVPRRPQLLEYLARKTGALVFTPNSLLTVGQKNEIVRELGVRVNNSHERDALVAALLAYNKYRDLFSKVDSLLTLMPLKLDAEEIKKDVVLGSSVKEAIKKQFWLVLNNILQTDTHYKRARHRESEGDSTLSRQVRNLSEKLAKAYNRIRLLESRIEELEEAIREKDREITALRDTIAVLRKENAKLRSASVVMPETEAVKRLQEKIFKLGEQLLAHEETISELRRINANLKKIVLKDSDQMVIKRLDELTVASVRELENTYGLRPDDVIFISRLSRIEQEALKMLASSGVRILIVPRLDEGIMERLNTAIGNASVILAEDFEHLCGKIPEEDVELFPKRCIEKALRATTRRFMDDIEASYDLLEETLEEWRKERIKALKAE